MPNPPVTPIAPEAEAVKGRQSRWTPAPRPVLLNAYDEAMLEAVSRHQPVTLPQLARLLGRSDKGCQRTARRLFDAQMLSVSPGPPTAAMSPQNAPTVRGLTEAGARRIDGGKRYAPPPAWKLGHELMVRDVAAWVAACCRAEGLEPPQVVYEPRLPGGLVPDALLTIPVGDKALCALVECDRGTEPSRQWEEKARLAVVCPDLARCAWVHQRLWEAGVEAWFSPASALAADDFGRWRVSDGSRQPFLPTSARPSNPAVPGKTPLQDR